MSSKPNPRRIPRSEADCKFASQFNYVFDSIQRGYITESDLKTVLKEEYATELIYKEKPPAV